MAEPFPPDHPFTAAEAAAGGVSRARLQALVGCGVVKHLLYGVYIPGGWEDTPVTRARAAAHVQPQHTVVVDRSAAALHGIDVHDYAELDVPPRLEVASVDAEPSRRHGVLGGKRDLVPSEITRVGDVRVTTPLRTACDIACLRGRHRAFATLEAFRTRFGFSQADLARMLPRFAGRRGVTQLRELIPLARAGADSQPESWVAIDLHDEGYPMPRTQVRVYVPGWGMAVLENAYEHLRIAVEYDGEPFHSEDADRRHDTDRRDALRVDADWIVVVVRRDGFGRQGREGWLAEFAEAYAERSPVRPPRRTYARSPDRHRWRRR